MGSGPEEQREEMLQRHLGPSHIPKLDPPVPYMPSCLEELLSVAGNMKMPVENRPGDNAILRVIEAYCVGGGRGGAIRKCAVSIL